MFLLRFKWGVIRTLDEFHILENIVNVANKNHQYTPLPEVMNRPAEN